MVLPLLLLHLPLILLLLPPTLGTRTYPAPSYEGQTPSTAGSPDGWSQVEEQGRPEGLERLEGVERRDMDWLHRHLHNIEWNLRTSIRQLQQKVTHS